MPRPQRLIAAVILALAVPASTVPAGAYSAGISGYSGKQMSRDCNDCHSGGKTPLVTIEGPSQMLPGALATFRITVKSTATSAQRYAGFNIAVSDGTLDVVNGATQGSRRWPQSGEISHSARKQNSNGQSSWDFTLVAPLALGFVDIFAAGNSTNANGSSAGDKADATSFAVRVVAPPTATPSQTATQTPSATPTRTPTATAVATATSTATPSETSTVAPSATATPSDPVIGDCDADGTVDAEDVEHIVELLNRCPACPGGGAPSAGCGDLTACSAADLDADTCITAAELTRVIAAMQ